MLIEFKFSNYRSFRDETILSAEAMGLGSMKQCLIEYRSYKLLPSVAIYGKNGGGKSNVIRAFWLAVQFIRNSQQTQHEQAAIPVRPFLLDDESQEEPTLFEFTYVWDNIKYIYGFSATTTEIVKEYLYFAPKGQKALVFSREYQNFTFRENSEKAKRKMISEAVAKNQLYFSVACTMNESACVSAMRWFREGILFSRDYTDVPKQLIEYSDDSNMLKAITDYAKVADVGIEDMHFDIKSAQVNEENMLPEQMPEEVKIALVNFMHALSNSDEVSESRLEMGQVTATSSHRGVAKDGSSKLYSLNLADESDGTRKLMAIAPGIEKTLLNGGLMFVDELENGMHPLLVAFIVSKFQNPQSNPKHAQIIFTTHDTALLGNGILRKDQIYFTDKDNRTGVSSLYSIGDFGTNTNENMQKGYLVGKYGAIPDLPIVEVE